MPNNMLGQQHGIDADADIKLGHRRHDQEAGDGDDQVGNDLHYDGAPAALIANSAHAAVHAFPTTTTAGPLRASVLAAKTSGGGTASISKKKAASTPQKDRQASVMALAASRRGPTTTIATTSSSSSGGSSITASATTPPMSSRKDAASRTQSRALTKSVTPTTATTGGLALDSYATAAAVLQTPPSRPSPGDLLLTDLLTLSPVITEPMEALSATPIASTSTAATADTQGAAVNTSSRSAGTQRRGLPAPNRIIPAFLNKLYNMVSDSSTDEHIHWNEDGTSFIVSHPLSFAKAVLPRFFKHNNFTSFNRQLNMYGFHKVPSIEHGSLLASTQKEVLEFSNENFLRDRPDLLCFAVRRTNTQSDELVKDGALDMNTVIHEISAIKRHQLTISADIQKFQRENEAMWNESVQLRDRYAKQQDTIDKILRFLASVFSSSKKPDVAGQKRRRIKLPDVPRDASGSGNPANFDHLSNIADLSHIIGTGMGGVLNFDAGAGGDPFDPSMTSANPYALSAATVGGMPPFSHMPTAELNNNAQDGISNMLQSPDFFASSLFGLSNDPCGMSNAPHLLNQLSNTTDRLATTTHTAQEVAEDIDLLQDRVYDIASAVKGLSQGQSNTGDWSVEDLIASTNPLANGQNDDHAALLALMAQQQPAPLLAPSEQPPIISSQIGANVLSHPVWPGGVPSSLILSQLAQQQDHKSDLIDRHEFDQFDELIEVPTADDPMLMDAAHHVDPIDELDQDYFNTFFSTS